MRARRGFTLIELLVVIAIIAILAGMLFPVFARAREAARKIQCLSNIKNIAMAVQMYLTDYDRFMPLGNMDPTAAAYFHSLPGGSGYSYPSDICPRVRQANPYAREQPILDEYIKNRDVWRCPSAKIMFRADAIVPAGRNGLWYNSFIDYGYGVWHDAYMCPPCLTCWPSGWGGRVTDSFVQGRVDQVSGSSEDGGEFVMGVAVNDNMHVQNPSAINDVSKYVVCGDSGGDTLGHSRFLAFPDVCRGAMPLGLPDSPDACAADWVNCPDSRSCGLSADSRIKFYSDPAFRKQYARHMGGSNIGFADGHAKWSPAETIVFQNCPWPDSAFEGLPTGCCWYPLPGPCQ